MLVINVSKSAVTGKSFGHFHLLDQKQCAILTCACYVFELLCAALPLRVPALLSHAEDLPCSDVTLPFRSCICAQLPLTIYLCISETSNDAQCLLTLRLHSPTQDSKIKTDCPVFLFQCSKTHKQLQIAATRPLTLETGHSYQQAL